MKEKPINERRMYQRSILLTIDSQMSNGRKSNECTNNYQAY